MGYLENWLVNIRHIFEFIVSFVVINDELVRFCNLV